MATSEKLNLGVGVQLSHEEPIEQSLIINIHGKPLSGKTMLIHTFSKHAPAEWPKERKSGKFSPLVLKDGASLAFDQKAIAGLKERGISVPNFDVMHFMHHKPAWSKVFKRQPTIHEVVEHAINALMQHGPRYVGVDTITTFDGELNFFWTKNVPQSEGGKDIHIQKYGHIYADHVEFIKQLAGMDCVIINGFHSTVAVNITTPKPEVKAKKETLQIAGGGFVEPAVTGKSALAYKAAASLQLALIANIKNDKGRMVYERHVIPIVQNDHEAKNRWALSLSDKEPPHLGKIFAKITA